MTQPQHRDPPHETVLAWYADNRRDLPWREPGTSPWAVLVSEVMLQQTPVARVLPAYLAWLDRWPAPPDLAAAPAGEAVRQWGRLGYPRRALRLHAVARILTDQYNGEVPATRAALLALPGIGTYTAAAVASFAFAQRHPVLDTNVRRVLARLITGRQYPPASLSVAETALAESLLPEPPKVAAQWSVALMELGALICTSTNPKCPACPVSRDCTWLSNGRPPSPPSRSAQPYEGTTRQCRGAILSLLRHAQTPLTVDDLASAWPDPARRAKALSGLISDGLVEPHPNHTYSLPTA
jgi:A/G-specific adenine glycosylase